MATINGNSSDDFLSGTLFNDIITGRKGDDTLTSGGGQDTFVVRRGDATDTIIDFGGVGTGAKPASAAIAQVDMLKFEGPGLSAENMLLTQKGSDLLISFTGIQDTQAILKDFDLEDLDNLQKSTGASVDIGNILFNGQTKIQDSFDVANANQDLDRVFNPNTVTFLNNLDNNTQGRNDSNDIINGQGGNDLLKGLSGDDILNGGSGSDTLVGSIGNDTYVVDSTTDSIIEDSNGETIIVDEGDYLYELDINIDLVKSSVRYTLGKNLENLTLTGNNAINGTGNVLDNVIKGNGANNFLYGNRGSDYLVGGNGNDKLYGQAGDDSLIGNSGLDTLIGGTGDDYYFVDSTIDTITEYSNQGTDTVSSGVRYTLGANLENLTLSGTSAINGTGNALANSLKGNDGNNTLNGGDGNDFLQDNGVTSEGNFDKDTLIGGAGNDYLRDSSNSTLIGGAGDDTLTTDYGDSSLIGGTGNDTYIVDRSTNVITEDLNAGVDTVKANSSYTQDNPTFSYTLDDNLENLIFDNFYVSNFSGIGNTLDNVIYVPGNVSNDYLFGDAGNDNLDGGTGNDTIDGGTGNDALIGGQGNHTLTGGADADTFTFYYTFLIRDFGYVAAITDFSVADDTINISADGFGNDLSSDAAITLEQFVLGPAAGDASDRFIYNQSTGALFFDSDGIGTTGQVQLAALSTGLSMTNADIFVI